VGRFGPAIRDAVQGFCKALLEAPAAPRSDPRRGDRDRQRAQPIAPPAVQVVLPREDLRGERERCAPERRPPEPAAAQCRAGDRDLRPQPLQRAERRVARHLVVPGEFHPARPPLKKAHAHWHPRTVAAAGRPGTAPKSRATARFRGGKRLPLNRNM
jgi:hypothetical protein